MDNYICIYFFWKIGISEGKKLNKSCILIIKVVVFFLLFNFTLMCRCYFDKSTTSHLHFLSQIAKTTIPWLKRYSYCFKGDMVFKPIFLCVFVHMCVHGLCVFTHVYLHMCLSVCGWGHDFFFLEVHNMINCIVWVRTWIQEATYLSIKPRPATS